MEFVCQILLGNGDLDGALHLLDQGSLEGIQSDVLLFNTILQGACEKVLFLSSEQITTVPVILK